MVVNLPTSSNQAFRLIRVREMLHGDLASTLRAVPSFGVALRVLLSKSFASSGCLRLIKSSDGFLYPLVG